MANVGIKNIISSLFLMVIFPINCSAILLVQLEKNYSDYSSAPSFLITNDFENFVCIEGPKAQTLILACDDRRDSGFWTMDYMLITFNPRECSHYRFVETQDSNVKLESLYAYSSKTIIPLNQEDFFKSKASGYPSLRSYLKAIGVVLPKGKRGIVNYIQFWGGKEDEHPMALRVVEVWQKNHLNIWNKRLLNKNDIELINPQTRKSIGITASPDEKQEVWQGSMVDRLLHDLSTYKQDNKVHNY